MTLKYSLARTIQTGMGKGLRGMALLPDGRVCAVGTDARIFDGEGRLVASWPLPGGPASCVAVQAAGVSDEARTGFGEIFIGFPARIKVYAAEDGRLQREFGEEGRGPGRLRAVTSLAVSGKDLYIADAGNRMVHHFLTDGTFVRVIGTRDRTTGAEGLVVPSPHLDIAILAGSSGFGGRLLVANPGRHRIELYGGDGRLVSSWGRASIGVDGFCGCCNPTDIAAFPDGRVVTSEKGIPRVKLHDAAGNVLAYIGPSFFGTGAAGIDLAASPSGEIYAADPSSGRIMVFAPEDRAAR